jgi:hypothetical protein
MYGDDMNKIYNSISLKELKIIISYSIAMAAAAMAEATLITKAAANQ